MTRKSKNETSADRLLTEVELELMAILWKLGEGNVADVIEQLPRDRKLAYTSVSTILRILEQKGVLTAKKEGRGHTYLPKVQKDEYEARSLKHMVNRVFDGTPVALVRQLLNSADLADSEIEEIKKLIQERERS